MIPDQLESNKKEAHLLPISEQQGTEPAWVRGPQFLKEKKQTLDMPLLLDSGKNFPGLCPENVLKLRLLFSERKLIEGLHLFGIKLAVLEQ